MDNNSFLLNNNILLPLPSENQIITDDFVILPTIKENEHTQLYQNILNDIENNFKR